MTAVAAPPSPRIDTAVARPSRSRVGTVVRSAASAALGVWWLAPLVPMLLWAFADRWTFPDRLPRQWGLDGWRAAFEAGAGSAMASSLAVAVVVAVIATPLGAMAARALETHDIRHGRLVGVLLVLPVAVPPFAVVLGLTSVTLRWGIPGSVALITALVAFSLPYTVSVMRAAYAAHDLTMEEQARTLGASPRSTLWRVHLPMVAPSLVMSAFLAFLVAWSDYLMTLVLGAGRVTTLAQLLGSSASSSGHDSSVAVIAALIVAPPLVLLAAIHLSIRRTAQR